MEEKRGIRKDMIVLINMDLCITKFYLRKLAMEKLGKSKLHSVHKLLIIIFIGIWLLLFISLIEDIINQFFANLKVLFGNCLVNLLDSLFVPEGKLSEQGSSHGFGIWETLV